MENFYPRKKTPKELSSSYKYIIAYLFVILSWEKPEYQNIFLKTELWVLKFGFIE